MHLLILNKSTINTRIEKTQVNSLPQMLGWFGRRSPGIFWCCVFFFVAALESWFSKLNFGGGQDKYTLSGFLATTGQFSLVLRLDKYTLQWMLVHALASTRELGCSISIGLIDFLFVIPDLEVTARLDVFTLAGRGSLLFVLRVVYSFLFCTQLSTLSYSIALSSRLRFLFSMYLRRFEFNLAGIG